MRVWILTAALLTVTFAPATGGTGPGEMHGMARAGTRPIVDAVVWLDAPGASTADDAPRPLLDQRNLEFWPHVLAVRVGTTVKFPNNDRVFHNVFSFHDGKKFDLGVYPIGAVKYVTFDRAGVSRLFCNIHPNMAAYVVSVDSPYFAVSDAAGRFTLRAPAGRYTYHAWRAGSQPVEGTVSIDGQASLNVQWP
jgi:plastocyanin